MFRHRKYQVSSDIDFLVSNSENFRSHFRLFIIKFSQIVITTTLMQGHQAHRVGSLYPRN